MKIRNFAICFAVIMVLASVSTAGVYIYNPDPIDMYGLDHHEAYQWGMNFDSQDEVVYDAILTIDNIRNWQLEENALFIHLLDEIPLGVTVDWDAEDGLVDAFAGQGILVDAWEDTQGDGWDSPGQNLSFSLRDLGLLDVFLAYASTGTFGFGFDPDCHFFNDGITFTVITDVPEPATALLFALGLMGVGVKAYRRKRS